MSTSRSIIFFSKEITPTLQKMIKFVRKGKHRMNDKWGEYYPIESAWIHPKGEGFEYFGYEGFKTKHKDLKTYLHIGQSGTTYGKDRHFYNYPYFHKLMEHIKKDSVEGIYLLCLCNSEKQRPKWIKEWKGKTL